MATGQLFTKAKRYEDAELIFADVFEHALPVLGPRHQTVCGALQCHWLILSLAFDRQKDAVALKARAAKLGCDVSKYVAEGN